MNGVAAGPGPDRQLLFEQAAVRKGVAFAVIEKDFWVCWTLAHLFALPGRHPDLLFKGGTSLSKVFGLIDRFSEDIDLSIDRRALGLIDDRDPEQASGNHRKRLLDELSEAASACVRDDLRPALESRFAAVIGDPGALWSLDHDDEDDQTLLFAYPTATEAGESYLRPVVRLELGGRSDQEPSAARTITSYAAELFPDEFETVSSEIRVLDAERTFWEKVTYLHALAHGGVEKVSKGRLSRHYYDVSMIMRSDVGERAIQDLALLARVAEHKSVYFAAAWARYDLARPGTLRLLPEVESLAILERDHNDSAEMFFGDVPSWSSIVGALEEVEDRING